MATIADLTAVTYSGNYRVDALLADQQGESLSVWNFLLDGRNTLFYTFDVSTGSEIDKQTTATVARFNTTQQNAARQILQHAASVTGITFTEVASSAQADVHFGASNIQGSAVAGLASSYYGYSYLQDGTLTRLNAEAIIYLDNVEHAGINAQPVAGSVGYEVLLHEVGHMLGLAHPFNSPRPLPAADDHSNNTVMSYTDRGAPKSVFQPYDLLALDWLYGRDGIGGTWGYNSVNGPSLALTPPPSNNYTGTGRADSFRSTSANETFDGLAGTDTLVLKGERGGYTLTATGDTWVVADRSAGRDGTDTLVQMERLRFSDMNVALDLGGAAGTTARILGAVLGQGAVAQREWVGIGLQFADDGVSVGGLARLALQAALGSSFSHTQVVNLLYANLFHAAPDAGTRTALTQLLDSGAYSPESLAEVAAFSDINAANIGLAGLQAQGLQYTPLV